MKLLSILAFLFLQVISLHAQQTPLFSVYRDQWAILNPAALSNNYLLNNRSMSLSGSWHVQWWGLANSPRTQAIAWECVSEEKNSVFGAHLLNDQTGKLGQTGAYLRYAYRINLGHRSSQSIVIGLNAGAVQYRAKLSEIEFPDPGSAPTANISSIKPDVGFGLFYHKADKFYAGVSVPQAFGFRSDFQQDENGLSIRRVQHAFAMAGGYLNAAWLGNETSFLEPSVWLKYAPNAPLNADINLRAQISELVWVGAGINTGLSAQISAALHFEAGLFFGDQVQLVNGQLKTGFAFDLPVTHGLSNSFGAAAEFNVVYSWK